MTQPSKPFDWTAWYAKIPGIPFDWGMSREAKPSVPAQRFDPPRRRLRLNLAR